MLKVDNLSFSYGEKPLYEGVSFVVSRGQKVGLVGANGSGKTTILKMLIGEEEGFTGKIIIDETLAIVPQEVKYDPDMDTADSVRLYVDPMNDYQDYELDKFFSGLELNLPLLAKPQKLSGGQKTKLALARALLSKPDVLLLDEPTNFMDVAGKKFVMDFLSEYVGSVIIISHDLELMDSAIDKILLVNSQTKKVEEYKGNYTKAMKLKAEADALAKRKNIIEKKHIKNLEESVERLRKNKSKKGVRARVIMQRRVERLKESLPELPPELKNIKINLPEPAKIGELPLKVIDISKSYGNLQVLNNVNFTVIRGDRVVLIGPNGAGKSTLIKILMGLIAPDNGVVIKNDQLKVGYYSQEFETFDFRKTVLATFCDETKKDEGFARAFLGKYMFLGQKAFQSVGSLSGGEKTRLSMAIITGTDNNLLILDEPTTYLDVTSQRVILEALKEYKGTMIVVSHTPEFIKELNPQKAVTFPDQKIVYWDNDLLDKVADQ
jgi:ATP-binding cassette, subfamily F, member 3